MSTWFRVADWRGGVESVRSLACLVKLLDVLPVPRGFPGPGLVKSFSGILRTLDSIFHFAGKDKVIQLGVLLCCSDLFCQSLEQTKHRDLAIHIAQVGCVVVKVVLPAVVVIVILLFVRITSIIAEPISGNIPHRVEIT